MPETRYGAELLGAQLAVMKPAPATAASEVRILVEVFGDGKCHRALLRTPDVYEVTAQAAVAVLRRVLHSEFEPGFQTPRAALRPDFVLSLPQVTRLDLPS